MLRMRILAVFLLAMLAACGSQPAAAPTNAPAPTAAAAVPTTAPAPTTAPEPTTAPAPTAAAAPTTAPVPTDAPAPTAAAASTAGFPVTIENCGQQVTYAKPPQRAVANDVNIVEMMFALGLEDRMAGISGVADKGLLLPEYQAAFDRVTKISDKYFTLEPLLGASPDFVFAGWSYGFSDADGITPAVLKEHGIDSYILTESCIRKGPKQPTNIEETFGDLRNLGKIFGVADRAEKLIAGYEQQLTNIKAKLPANATPLRVFVYDSGEDSPFTAGGFAIPNDLIERAGGDNIAKDIQNSWTTIGWETVVERNPQIIVIVDYDTPDAAGKEQFLLNNPTLANVDAIKNKRFVVLPYAAATPGPRNAGSVLTLAQAFYPEAFK